MRGHFKAHRPPSGNPDASVPAESPLCAGSSKAHRPPYAALDRVKELASFNADGESVVRGSSKRISRRAILGGFASALACLAQETDPWSRLRKTHSRLLLQDSDLDRIKLLIRDNPLAKRIYTELEKECEKLQTALPVDYKLTGNRLLAQCRKAVDRIGTLALMFRVTGKESYLHRAVLEMRACANFKDWNPAHFLDTAEMSHAMALGYDWLHPALSFEERAWIAGAIVGKGLDPAIAAYQAKATWTTSRYYWNPVCNSGILLGALAVAEDFAPKSSSILKSAMDSLSHVLTAWGSDGGWPEGPYYGDFAGRSMTILTAALETAFGSDLGLIGTTGISLTPFFQLEAMG